MADIGEHIKFPVRYDDAGQMVWDADSHLILDIRGWGRLQYEIVGGQRVVNERRGIEIQDQIGTFVVASMNEKFNRENYPTEPDILAAGYEKIETGAFKRKAE